MRRKLVGLVLGGFLAYTAAFVFVYLWRSFRVERPQPLARVGLYHGDEFSRMLLVALLFLIGEVFAVYLLLAARRRRSVELRRDLADWLAAREALTGEPADSIAERAVAAYRARLEGGTPGEVPSAPDAPMMGR